MDADKKKNTPDGVRAALQMRDSYDERNRLQDVEAPSLNFQDYIFDTTTEPEPPDYLLEINGVGVMPRGGLTVVSGEKKNGKTSFLTAMVATMMSGRDFGTMRRRTAPGKILWVDTEQSSNDMSFAFERLFRQACIPLRDDSKKHDFYILKTRPLAPVQREQVLRDAVEQLQPSVVIVDGIRDLIEDFNDVTQSHYITTEVLRMLDQHPHMNVVCVIHTNPDSTRLRGHLGRELENKCRDLFNCVKGVAAFTVTHESRGRQYPGSFVFCIANTENGATLQVTTIEAANGVIDPEQAFIASVPEDGADYYTILSSYRKLTNMSKADADAALKRRIASGDLVKNLKTRLFHRKK